MDKYGWLILLLFYLSKVVFSQNPIIRDQFTADPSARVFKNRVYVYPSHDIRAPEGKGLRKDWFCMEDYHVFSSNDLVNWIDHGIILTQYQVPWVDTTSFSMWAPDCVEHNGKYYFYFPAISNEKDSLSGRKLFRIGVAIADSPEGPFVPQPEPIKGIVGIDPCVFIDKDGQAYIYWSLGNIFVAKLKENMIEIESEPLIIENLPEKGLKEGPWVFERNGIYYLTFPHVANKIERLEYAMGRHPMGPFKMAGVIMDESPINCWTNHHSIVEYKGQWYLFYHQNYLSPHFDKNRSVCIDSLFFNDDGTIRKVVPTFRGVGINKATDVINIDRYSFISLQGVSIDFIDSTDTFKGWKLIMNKKNSWVQYNNIDFGNKKLSSLQLKILSNDRNILIVKYDNSNGPLIAKIKIPKTKNWSVITSDIKNYKPGIHNIYIELKKDKDLEIDWIKFQ